MAPRYFRKKCSSIGCAFTNGKTLPQSAPNRHCPEPPDTSRRLTDNPICRDGTALPWACSEFLMAWAELRIHLNGNPCSPQNKTLRPSFIRLVTLPTHLQVSDTSGNFFTQVPPFLEQELYAFRAPALTDVFI